MSIDRRRIDRCCFQKFTKKIKFDRKEDLRKQSEAEEAKKQQAAAEAKLKAEKEEHERHFKAQEEKLKAENKTYEAQADRVLKLMEEQEVEDHFHGDNVQEW